MKRNTPLDYAEFLLTHSRTRCEVQICANGVKEKLASGFLKPFVAHLRAAEEQVAKGNQVVRLERPSNFLKKNKVTWFTKGTLERFVRFVSTPEVLERIKNIDDELSQLEHVRVVLSRTSPQNDIPFHAKDTINSGVYQRKGSASMKDRRLSVGVDNGADSSKIELLKAMDVRLIAVKQEQSEAFSQAIAAGFDSSNMADLLDFSEHFGAVRLGEACIQYVNLFRKRNIAQEVAESMESPPADAASSDSDMSLESCMDFEPIAETGNHFALDVKGEWSKASKNNVLDSAGELNLEVEDERDNFVNIPSSRIRSRWGPPERIQINRLDPEVIDGTIIRKKGEVKHQLGNYSHQEDIGHSNNVFQASGEFQTTEQTIPAASVSRFEGNRSQGMEQGQDDIRGGMFFSRLHKMAQQVEARSSIEDLGVHFTSVERSTDSSSSQLSGHKYSSPLYDSFIISSSNPPSSSVSDGVAVQPQRPENILVPGLLSSGRISSMLEQTPKVKSGSPNSAINSAVDHVAAEDGDKDRKDNLEKSGHSTSESSILKDKQAEPVSTNARRLSVQAAISLFESKKVTVGEPPTRKLGRQDSQKGAVQSGSSSTEKSVLRRWSEGGADGMDTKQDTASEIDKKDAEKAEPIENVAQKAETIVEDRLRMDKLSQLAIDTSSTHARESATQAVPVDTLSLKQMPPAQQESSLSHEIYQKQSRQELEKILTRSSSSNLRMSVNLSSKPGANSLKPDEVTIRKGTMVPGPGNKDIRRAPVRKELVDVQEQRGFQKSEHSTEQKLEAMSGSLGIFERAPKRLPDPQKDNFGGQSVEKAKVGNLQHVTGKSRPDENKIPSTTTEEPEKEPSLFLHDTSVDLYMQALVMMIDNNRPSSQSLGDEEACKEHRGRFYEHYRRLRNERQRGENPAKRAEREAKLKSMQEILERRKAEMEVGVCRQVKSSRLIKKKEGRGHLAQESGPLMLLQEEKEMGEDTVVAQQDRLVLSHAQIMPKTKVQAARNSAPKFQKSALTSCSIKAARTISENQYCQSLNSAGFTPTESNTAAAFVDSHSSKTENVDFTSQPQPSADARHDRAFSSAGGPLHGKAYTESFEGHTESDTFLNDNSSSLAQNVEHQHHEYFSSAGTGILKHEGFDYRYPASWEGRSCPPLRVLDDCAEIVFSGREGTGGFDMRKYVDSSNLSHPVKHSVVIHPEKSRSKADIVQYSNQEPLESLNDESAQYGDDDASNDGNILFANQVDEEKCEEHLQKDKMPSGFCEYDRSSALTSAEKSVEISQTDSTCSSSLPQELTTSTYTDAAASPMNSFKEDSGTVLGTNSPRLSISTYSPSGSPIAWTSSKTKHLSEHEMLSSVPQSTKEPARGFKRFLRFGRKSRNSDSPLTDGISISTASEGDDEAEEVKEPMRQSSNDLFQRAKSQEKERHLNNHKSHHGFHDQGATYSLQTIIPTPPSNFKALDARFLGGTSLKASRSFFSLSSFRSKGGEGKSR